jgi:hypothetical protein
MQEETGLRQGEAVFAHSLGVPPKCELPKCRPKHLGGYSG